MLKGVRIYTSDTIWRQILTDFGATVLDAPTTTDINFDNLNISSPLTPMELKSAILNANDNASVLREIFGADVSLPRLQAQIIVSLYKSGGMTGNELKDALGSAPDVATHTVDTAIYQLRRAYGRGFIINSNGMYRLGKL